MPPSWHDSPNPHQPSIKKWPFHEMLEAAITPPLSMSKPSKSNKLVESTVVVGDLSQRQMVMKEHQEKNKHRNRAVYNDWGLYTFLEMLAYKCQLSGKTLVIISERDTSKMCTACGNLMPMPLWK